MVTSGVFVVCRGVSWCVWCFGVLCGTFYDRFYGVCMVYGVMVCYVGTFAIDFTNSVRKSETNVGTLSQNFQIKNFFTKKFFSGDPSTFSKTRRRCLPLHIFTTS